MPKPYEKVINLKNTVALCAIYEPHPMRNIAIKEVVKQSSKTYSWCWVYYDCVGNPVSISSEQPIGDIVYKIPDSLNGKEYAKYLNKEPIF